MGDGDAVGAGVGLADGLGDGVGVGEGVGVTVIGKNGRGVCVKSKASKNAFARGKMR